MIDAVSTGIRNEPRTRSIPPRRADIVEIHGLGQHEERVGVETANQFLPVVVEIGLHLIAAPRLEFFLLAHRFATESIIEDLGRAVGDLGDLRANARPCQGPSPGSAS